MWLSGGLSQWLSGEESACNARDAGDVGLIPGLVRCHGRGWEPTPGSVPEKYHGQRSLVGYNPWGCREDTTEHAHMHTHDWQGWLEEETWMAIDQAAEAWNTKVLMWEQTCKFKKQWKGQCDDQDKQGECRCWHSKVREQWVIQSLCARLRRASFRYE